MTTVLYLQTGHCEVNARSLDGAMAFARDAGVRLQLVECWRKLEVGKRLSSAEVRRLVALWQASAIVVDCGSPHFDPRELKPGKVPVVYLDCRRFRKSGGVFFCSDDEAVADAAIRELMVRPVKALAYVAWPGKAEWSANREARFRAMADLNGFTASVYAKPALGGDCDQRLESWLQSLEKPCGIFAANDYVAQHVVGCAVRIGMDLPCEVSVVGVDNERALCEASAVSLSSIQADFFSAGYQAAQAAWRSRDQSAPPVPDGRFGVLCVVRRLSTRGFSRHDERVLKAVDYIRFHACGGIDVADVIGVMSCSRRLGEMRFREVTGHSILDEIRSVRVRKAEQQLLNPHLSVAEVAQSCGYASPEALRKAFLAVHGETLADWRRQRVDPLSI